VAAIVQVQASNAAAVADVAEEALPAFLDLGLWCPFLPAKSAKRVGRGASALTGRTDSSWASRARQDVTPEARMAYYSAGGARP